MEQPFTPGKSEEAGRLYALQYLRQSGLQFATVKVNDFQLKIDLNDGIIGPNLYVYGEWEPYESELMGNLLRPGMTFVDIGANIGYYSVLAGRRVGPGGRVLAFEPAPDNFTLLQENISLNGLAGIVQAEHAALARCSGELLLYLNKYINGDHRIYQTGPEDDTVYNMGASRQAVPVPALALDQYLYQHGIVQVDMIKIDVQGAEMEVFSGASEAMRWNKNLLLFMEYWPRGLRGIGTDPEVLVHFLTEDLGMSLFHILPGERRLVALDPAVLIARSPAMAFEHYDLLCGRSPQQIFVGAATGCLRRPML